MLIETSSLKVNSKLEIDESLIVEGQYLEKTEIIELKNVKVLGEIEKAEMDNYYLNIVVKGIMVLPDSLTLEPTENEFEIEIDGNIDELLEEIEEKSKKTQFSIDIFPIIWENILMEIPIRVVKKDASNIKLEGNGWRVIKENDNVISSNPELEKLKDLLNEK